MTSKWCRARLHGQRGVGAEPGPDVGDQPALAHELGPLGGADPGVEPRPSRGSSSAGLSAAASAGVEPQVVVDARCAAAGAGRRGRRSARPARAARAPPPAGRRRRRPWRATRWPPAEWPVSRSGPGDGGGGVGDGGRRPCARSPRPAPRAPARSPASPPPSRARAVRRRGGRSRTGRSGASSRRGRRRRGPPAAPRAGRGRCADADAVRRRSRAAGGRGEPGAEGRGGGGPARREAVAVGDVGRVGVGVVPVADHQNALKVSVVRLRSMCGMSRIFSLT